MKKIILIAISVILLSTGNAISDSKNDWDATPLTKMTIVYISFPSPPMILGKGTKIDHKKPGTTIELLKLVERNLNLDIHFKRVPWKRCQFMLEMNEADGAFHASFKKARLKMGMYPMKNGKHDPDKRLTYQAYALYKLKNSPFAWDGKKFDNPEYLIGASIGSAIIDTLKKKGAIIDEGKNVPHCMMKLLKGRITAYAELETMADAYLARNHDKFKNIVKVSSPIKRKPYYLMLSHKFVKKYPGLSKRIWDEIEKVRESEEFNAIFMKYLQ